MKPVRSPIYALVFALALTACGSGRSTATSSTTAAPSPSTVPSGAGYEVGSSQILIREPAAIGGITLPVGDRLVFRLGPATGHHPDGSPVTWPAPTTTAKAVLRPVQSGSCPDHDTCADFVGSAAGDSVVDLIGPGGVICGGHPSSCVGVSSMLYRIPVQVKAGGQPGVVPRSPS